MTAPVLPDPNKPAGAPEGKPDPTPKGEENKGEEGDPPGAEHLGDPGKKALDTMKEERRLAREEAAKYKAQAEALQAERDGKQAEHQAELAKRETEQAALGKANERILKAELRAASAGKLADPKDALLFLDITKFEVGTDGEVDSDAIASAIDDLVKNKPYLAAQGEKRFQGGADGGARNGSEKSIDDQIIEAQKAGNLQLTIALKQRRSAELAAKK
jgi:hypothetical protein